MTLIKAVFVEYLAICRLFGLYTVLLQSVAVRIACSAGALCSHKCRDYGSDD